MIYTRTYKVIQNNREVLSATVTLDSSVSYQNIVWDSKTGLITAQVDEETVVLSHTGKAYGTIAPGEFTTIGFSPDDMNYHYWYY